MKPAYNPDILVVDDVPENLRLLTVILKADGCRVRPVASGRLAVQAALHAIPDLILLDIKMPEMDGFQVCAQLKAELALKDIPVIFISALNETRDKLAAFEAGGVDYITKPFQEQEVLARVRTHLQLNRQKAELQENIKQLQQLEQLRDSLTHMIVHDMRAPIMTIRCYLQLLSMELESFPLSAKAKDYMHGCQTVGNRIDRMVASMLAVSKFESGTLKPHCENCDVAELASRVVSEMSPRLSGKSVRFSTDGSRVYAFVDPDFIGRILENLIGNGLKYSPPSGVVQVRLVTQDKLVRFEVADEGVGIALENREKIFDKYFQVEEGHPVRGFGLGLTFCKLAVEAHGGRIGVESNNGQGSLFWFTLDRLNGSKSGVKRLV